MKVLITGGNGFIGSHLCESLIDRGETVFLFDRNFTSNTKEIYCQKIRGDIKNYADVTKIVDGKDVIFHFAAISRVIWGQQDPYSCWSVNVLGTLNVLEACRKMERPPVVIYASSREVYGEPLYLPVDEAHPKSPKSIYGNTKLSSEKACFSYFNTFGINVLILRFSNVYGSQRDLLDRVIPKFMLRALSDKEITLYGGDQVLDFTLIDDVISGVLEVYKKILDGDIIFGQDFHFVTGEGISINELSKKIINLCNSSSRVINAEPNNFDVQRFIGDPTKLSCAVGFQLKTRLHGGLKVLMERLLRSNLASN